MVDPAYAEPKQSMVPIGDMLLSAGNIGEAIATYDPVLNIDPKPPKLKATYFAYFGGCTPPSAGCSHAI